MVYNIVTNFHINQFLKSNSKYYKVNLGYSYTVEGRTGDRVPNSKDEFAFVYNSYYKASIVKQGQIGDIVFYTDHNINENVVLLYIDREEFVHHFEHKFVKSEGVDSYLGRILKESDEEYQKIKDEELKPQTQDSQVGDADKVIQNPGNVTHADLKAYLEKKNSARIKL